MLKTYEILLDLENELYTPATLLFSVSRNDFDTVQLTLKINQDNAPFDLTGKTVELAVKKPSGLTVYQQAEVTEATAGEATLMLSIQAYIEYGVHTAEVYIRDGEQLAVTSPFYYNARSAVMDAPEVESVNDWSALIKALFAYDLKPIITDSYPTEVPEYVGQMAFNALDTVLYLATDLTAEAWQQIGGEGGAETKISLGEGAPSIAPSKIGQLYIDTLAPAAYMAIAADTWRRIDNENIAISWGEILEKPLTFPADPHTHAIEDVVGLPDALTGKAALDHTHAEYVTEPEGDLRYKLKTDAPTAHGHEITEVTGLTAALDGKAAVDHNHDAAYSPINHNHDAAYSPIGHGHEMTDITGLPAALEAKADKSYVDAADNVILGRLGGLSFEALTQAEYDALAAKDANTVYFING